MSPAAGKAILLLHHMDVVPADRAQWKTDPFTPTIQGDELWGRGSMDMKGQGVAQLVAFLMLKRQNVPRTRDVILMAEPDEEVGGALGARWMIANHYAELDPEYVIDEGGFGSTDLFAPNKMVYGISVAEKKIVWLKLRAEGVAGHGSQPTDTNPNDRLVKALARLLGDGGARAFQASADRSAESLALQPSVLDMMQAKVGAFAKNKFTNAIQQSTISLTWFRSGVGDPPKINVIPSVAEAGLDCRVLPGTTQGSVDRRGRAAARRSGDQDRADQRVGRSGRHLAGRAALPQHRGGDQAAPSRGDRHADPDPVRHRLERVPPEGREELRHLPRAAPGGRRRLDARRRRAHQPRQRARGGAGPLRGAARHARQVTATTIPDRHYACAAT